MRKEKTLFIIGLWVIILPFLGFTNTWRQILFVISGLSIIYLAYLFYLEYKYRSKKEELVNNNTFIDNIGSGE